MRLHGLRVDVQGVDDGAGAVRRGHMAGRGPGLGLEISRGLAVAGLIHVHGLHHLADQAVAQDHDGVAVAVGDVKGLLRQRHSLLHRAGRQHAHAVVAMTAAARGLVVVALRGLNAAQAGAAAHHVDDDAGQLSAHDVADALLLEADSGRGGAGHHAPARAGRAVDHVDGRDLAFGLQKAAAHLGHALGHVFGNLILGRDGIAEKEAASGLDGSLGNRLVALQELFHGLSFLPCAIFPR